MTKRLDPHDGWTPEVQVEEQPPLFDNGARAERLARAFHETYERLAPDFGYRTREASAVPWDDVPDANRRLMVATAAAILANGAVFLPADELGETELDRFARRLGIEVLARRADADELGRLRAALWECGVESGMDTDGDTGPGAMIAGMGDAGFAAAMIEQVRQLRRDYDECLTEGSARDGG